jgi:hypothetical protein
MMASPAPSQDEFRVEEITGTNVVPLTYELRYRVWSKETRLIDSFQKMGVIRDEHEAHSRHWAAFSWGGTLAASARLCIHDTKQHVPEDYCYTDLDIQSPVASINRLVVEPSARTRGIMDWHRIEAAKNAGGACIVAAPTSENRIRALERFGFSLRGFRRKSNYLETFSLSVMVRDL